MRQAVRVVKLSFVTTSKAAAKQARTGTKPPLGTRERILAAALELFAERGFASTTTAEIARAAKVAEKTLFAHFKSKEALFEQTLAPASLELLIAESNFDLPTVFTTLWETLEEFLMAVMKNRLALFARYPSKFKFIVQELLLRPELASPFRDKFHCHVAPLYEAALKRLQEHGQMRDLPSDAVHRMLGSVLLGYAVQRFIMRPDMKCDEDRDLQLMVDMLARGLRPCAEERSAARREPRASTKSTSGDKGSSEAKSARSRKRTHNGKSQTRVRAPKAGK